jgi:integrase
MSPTLPEAIEAFREALIAKSPRTAINYVSALARFREFLPTIGLDPDAAPIDRLPDDVLERFYAWLLKTRGRDRRTTAVAYTTAVRAFFRYLRRRCIAVRITAVSRGPLNRYLLTRQPR